MKQLKFATAFLLSFLLFASCKKDKAAIELSKAEIAGVYAGKYGTGDNTPASFYSFQVKEDGTMHELNSSGQIIGTGAWTITGTSFRASYHYTFPSTSFFVASGTYDPATKKLTGTWGYGSNDSNGGKWHMTKL
jgi:hypothetical protein